MAVLKNLIRVAGTDIDTRHHLIIGLSKIKGVSIMFSNAVCRVLNYPIDMKIEDLKDEQITKIEELLKDPSKSIIPKWMYNRQRDHETGEDKHLIGITLDLTKDDDIKLMKKIKSYKGLRHQWGLTVRGQRTQSNFRKKNLKKRK